MMIRISLALLLAIGCQVIAMENENPTERQLMREARTDITAARPPAGYYPGGPYTETIRRQEALLREAQMHREAALRREEEAARIVERPLVPTTEVPAAAPTGRELLRRAGYHMPARAPESQ